LLPDELDGAFKCSIVERKLSPFKTFKPFNRCAPFKTLSDTNVPAVPVVPTLPPFQPLTETVGRDFLRFGSPKLLFYRRTVGRTF